MWQQRMKGRRSANDAATEPSATSVSFEFQVRPTLGWEQTSMIRRIRDGTFVWSPWTSTQISTPWSRAKAPHSASARPICSSVFSSGTSFGSPFGRTLTPRAPMSFARRTHSRQSSTFFLTTGRVGRVELADRAEARLQEARVRALLPHVGALGRGQRPLDAVGVGRPELDALEAGLAARRAGACRGPSPSRRCRSRGRGGSVPAARARAPRASAPADASPIRTTSRRVRTMVPPRVSRIVSPAPRPVQM